MLQEPEVIGHAVGALGDGGQYIQNPAVGFPGIGLAADGEAALKAEGGGDPAVHLVDFRPVALKLASVPVVPRQPKKRRVAST